MEVNRLVERCLKESRPIDVESLCLVAGEKVFMLLLISFIVIYVQLLNGLNCNSECFGPRDVLSCWNL